jgi:hypothetical protein
MARQLSMATRRELKQAVGECYLAAGRWELRQILDEFARVTGYHRKHAREYCIGRSCHGRRGPLKQIELCNAHLKALASARRVITFCGNP